MSYKSLNDVFHNTYVFEECLKKIVKKWNSKIELINYEYFSQGRMNYLFLVEILNGKRREQMILRICLEDTGDFSQNFGQDYMLMKLWEEYSFLNGSHVYLVDKSKAIIPYQYELMEYIPGICLDNKCDIQVFENLGNIIGKLHSIPLDAFGAICDSNKKNIEATEFYLQYFYQAIHIGEKYNSYLTQKFARIFEKNFHKCNYMGKIPVLIHHDLHSRNVILAENKRIVLIDWDSARGGIGEYDFIKMKYINSNSISLKQKQAMFGSYLVKKKTAEFGVDLCIYELCWLLRMGIFESLKYNQDSYFPETTFYFSKFLSYCENFERYLEDYQKNKSNFWIVNV